MTILNICCYWVQKNTIIKGLHVHKCLIIDNNHTFQKLKYSDTHLLNHQILQSFFSDEICYFATRYEHANIRKVNTKGPLARLKESHIISAVCAGSCRHSSYPIPQDPVVGSMWIFCVCRTKPATVPNPAKATLTHLQLFRGPAEPFTFIAV